MDKNFYLPFTLPLAFLPLGGGVNGAGGGSCDDDGAGGGWSSSDSLKFLSEQ